MTSPVKLSRERWEMLVAKPPAAEGWCYPHAIIVTTPREIDGITFLPAEYVPAETAWRPGSAPNADGSRSQYAVPPAPQRISEFRTLYGIPPV